MKPPAVRIDRLTVRDLRGRAVLDDVSLEVAAGSVHVLVGESGSGKTTLALALLGLVRSGLSVVRGTVTVAAAEPLRMKGARLRAFRRSDIAFLGQDPALALTPHLTVRALLTEAGGGDDDALLAVLADAGLVADAALLSRMPRRLSGGQRRRVALARALCGGGLLVLDEPTSGLDAGAIADVTATIARIRGRGRTIFVITHDLGFARAVGDEVTVLASGAVVEWSPVADLAAAALTSRIVRSLADAELPHRSRRAADPAAAAVLHARALDVDTPDGDPVVRGLDLTLRRGRGIAVLGRSGRGKSTLARSLIGLPPAVSGTLELDGRPLARDLRQRSSRQARAVQLVPQDPGGSLNPALTVGTQLRRAIRRVHGRRHASIERAVLARRLEEVGLDEDVLDCHPRTLSGGQAQRVAIARALAHEPAVLICDEATAALDPTVQRLVLDLLLSLQRERDLALLVITHDRRVAEYTCDSTVELLESGDHRLVHVDREEITP